MMLRNLKPGSEFILKRDGKRYSKSAVHEPLPLDFFVCLLKSGKATVKQLNIHGQCQIELITTEEINNVSN